MYYTKQQLLEMYVKYAKEKINESADFRNNCVPKNMREEGEINTLISFVGGRSFIVSLEN